MSHTVVHVSFIYYKLCLESIMYDWSNVIFDLYLIILINCMHFALNSRNPLLSILLAMFTVSPNKQYLGIVEPTTPAAHGPL